MSSEAPLTRPAADLSPLAQGEVSTARKFRLAALDEARHSFDRVFTREHLGQQAYEVLRGCNRTFGLSDPRVGQRALHSERSLLRDQLGQCPRARDVFSVL